MRNLFWAILTIFLLSCTGSTGSSPTGGPGGPLGSVGDGSTSGGLGAVGEGAPGGVNQAAPGMDSGDVLPVGDPQLIVIQMTCSHVKCMMQVPIDHPNYDPNETVDETCVHFEGHLGLPINGWTPCCNNRYVRLVDVYNNQYVDYLTHNVDGKDGGFEAAVSNEGYVKIRVFLAPEGFVPGELDTWKDCGGDCLPDPVCTGVCPPDQWQEFLDPFHDQSCGFMEFMEPPTFKINPDVFFQSGNDNLQIRPELYRPINND
ncbi:MAG: hypothetical protein R3257_04645 [bacterium]|nr:hypothetical protein [bacterium]